MCRNCWKRKKCCKTFRLDAEIEDEDDEKSAKSASNVCIISKISEYEEDIEEIVTDVFDGTVESLQRIAPPTGSYTAGFKKIIWNLRFKTHKLVHMVHMPPLISLHEKRLDESFSVQIYCLSLSWTSQNLYLPLQNDWANFIQNWHKASLEKGFQIYAIFPFKGEIIGK